MAIGPQIPFDQYVSLASQTIFIYTFRIDAETELLVYDKPAASVGNDATQLKTLNVDYTVTGVGDDAGGTIVFLTGRTAGHIITIRGNKLEERETDLSPGNTISVLELNDELDAQVRLSQQISVQDNLKTPHYQNSELLTTADLNLPKLPPDYIWRKRADGVAIEAVPLSDSGGDANALRADLASHSAGKGASLVGLFGDADAGTVQDLAFNYANVINVAANGNDDTADGGFYRPYLTVQAAMQSITPVGENRFLIIVHEGPYDIGGLLLKRNVSIVVDCGCIFQVSSPVTLDPSWDGVDGINFYCNIVTANVGTWTMDFSALVNTNAAFFFDRCLIPLDFNYISAATNSSNLYARDCLFNNVFFKDMQPLTADCIIQGTAEFVGENVASEWQSIDTAFASTLTVVSSGGTQSHLLMSGGRTIGAITIDGLDANIEFGVENFMTPTLLNGGAYSLRNIADGLLANRTAINYVPTSDDVKGHLDGIDAALFSSIIKIAEYTASNSPSIDITDLAGYSQILIVLKGITPVNNNNLLKLRFSIDNGANFILAADSYRWTTGQFNGTVTSTDHSNSSTYILVGGDLGNSANHGVTGNLIVILASDLTSHSTVNHEISRFGPTGILTHESGSGERKINEVNNALQLFMDTGNIATGHITVYGYEI